jgi:hypothetical protein
VIRISITAEAFDAGAKTLPLGTVAFEGQPNEKGERVIFPDDWQADKLAAMRRPGESYSDVILRLAATAMLPHRLHPAARRVQPESACIRPDAQARDHAL